MNRSLALSVGMLVVALFVLARPGSSGQAAPQAAPLDVVINEVAWGGTAASTADEWIELYNNTGAAVDLSGWTLTDGGDISISLAGVIPAHGYFLLERTDDNTVSDIPADQIYTGSLNNNGERLELRDATNTLIDSADGSGGWPGGSGSPGYFSMERIDPTAADAPTNWAANDGLTRNGHDADGNPLNGTPKARNSVAPLPGANLIVRKEGPATARPGAPITYTITLSNGGSLAARNVRLTDTLPGGVQFLTHTAPYTFGRPSGGTLVWELGTVATAATPLTFTVRCRVSGTAAGILTNRITATSATTETNPADNAAAWTTAISAPQPVVVIEALHYDGYEADDADEAVRLMNVSTVTADLSGWQLSDGSVTAAFPDGVSLAGGAGLWCARSAVAFARQFGFPPDFETDDTDPAVPELNGGWPGFANDGDECLLRDDGGNTVDVLVYRAGDTATPGWSGPALAPWTPSNAFAAEGQILYRKRDQATGLPVADSDTAADWAQDPDDHINGRKVRYPGWDLDTFFFTRRLTETATLTVAVAPDNLYDALAPLLARAQNSIQIEVYSFKSKELADILLDRLAQGVTVTLLLEGAPAVEGVTDQERWIVGQLRDAGATILFMVNDDQARIHDRYAYLHSKLIIVDGTWVAIGSENLNYTSAPADDKGNGTAGRRGVFLITDAPGVVAHAQALFAADADTAHHADLMTCAQVSLLCTPPVGYQPVETPDWTTYTIRISHPLTLHGEMAFELIQSPENSLRDRDGLLGLLAQAGAGDTLLIEQFYEYSHWGPSDGTPETDPNPRLEAYVAAARRGAAVRLLLDGHFDGGKNRETMTYLRRLSGAEGLDLEVRQGDPTFQGLHNKMILAHIGGKKYVHVGSINGGEASNKTNRELALQVQSDDAYDYLRAVFEYDWLQSVPPLYLPLLAKNYAPPQPADHLLVSEVYYAVSRKNEWVEIVNPTNQTVDLTGYRIGDAAERGSEGMYRFPAGTTLAPHRTLVIAASGDVFRQFYGRTPDFEFFDMLPDVPDMVKDKDWSEGDWGLDNNGDEVLILDADGQAVDVLVYGAGSYPGVVPHPGVALYTHSLERFPYLYDTDDCSQDFRDWPFPNPGELP